MSKLSQVYLVLPGTSGDALPKCQLRTLSHVQHVQYISGIIWDIPAKSPLHSLVPRPRRPMYTWDHLGHPGMSQLSAYYTALSLVLNVPCVPGINRDIPGCPS